ncbi:1-aminocyclopropane-1-carboxylate deaminase [Saliniradius amylolyticus]|uniref:1-aminocyclopropane-1-carboxylate deaminase n=1 Tax=Saliniradius amylolyticus TaxID=2183582 RepID=A0A2S2E6K7_9ALTE|nr:pyridoxal-phosphate dependent enzyme [Saliniradius amylolyticus]AWL12890.1 1-aminocyclopropane-1-carboxylate deaminase [Saliniradius amylolyticus]
MSVKQLKAELRLPSPISPVTPSWPGSEALSIAVKRDDLIHPRISGNKWRKLKYALEGAERQGVKQIVSFGGGHSNHLHALSFACHQLGIRLEAIVRGQYQNNLTSTLLDMRAWGAQLHFVTKVEYQRRTDAGYLNRLKAEFPQAAIIPEGGSQQLALKGVAELLAEQPLDFEHIVLPVGSGGTLAGLMTGLVHRPDIQVHGIGVLKGQGYLEDSVEQLIGEHAHSPNWRIHHGFHHGGYAKRSKQLEQFCRDFAQQTGIALEPVYSGKCFWAVKQLMAENVFAHGSRILMLHTGGLPDTRRNPN